MSSVIPIAGSFSALYIGNYGGSTMTRVNQIGTGGYRFNYKKPKEKFVKATSKFEQTSAQSVGVDLSFLSDDPDGVKLAMSNPLSANQDDSPTDQQYVVLMVDYVNVGSSILIPRCESLTEVDIFRDKKEAVKIPLKFRWIEPNSKKQIFYKRSNSALATILTSLGITSPI